MSRASWTALLAMVGVASSGCGYTPALYPPQIAAKHELVLGYDEGYVISAEGRALTRGYGYEGLAEYVRCVPEAHTHALAAESSGAAAVPLQMAGGVIAVGGVGGLVGLGYIGKDNKAAAGLLLGGLGAQVLGLILVAAGAQAKVNANGHAVDAMNYYNDAVGSRGLGCARQ